MDIASYYAARASEYDSIYAKPERQPDLRKLEGLVLEDLTNRKILEVACGTGYWTEKVSKVAESILAIDLSEAVLEIARSRPLDFSRVKFIRDDLYSLPPFEQPFTGGLAGFWWSHVPMQKRASFLSSFLSRFSKNATICFFDNRYVEGSSTSISRRDELGNTYQNRKLNDGRETEVLKNFDSEEDLRRDFELPNTKCEIVLLAYYWYVRLTAL